LDTENPGTPKQTNVCQARVSVGHTDDHDGSITTGGTLEVNDTIQESARDTTEDVSGFRLVHYRLFNVVTSWMQQENAKKYPFYLKWQKATFAGLTALTKWERVAEIFKLSGLHDYVSLMNECPKIHESIELTWDFFTNTIRHKELALPATSDIITDINKLNDLQRQMQQLAFKFDSCMKDYNHRLDVSDTRITKYEYNLAEQLNRATARFASSATRHYNSLTEFASTTLRTFQGDITDFTEKHLTIQRGKIIDMHRANQDTIQVKFTEAQQELSSRLNAVIANAVESTIRTAEQEFKSRLDQAIETAIQELLSTADDATDHMNQQAEYLLREMVPSLSEGAKSWKTAQPKPSKLFPQVDVSQICPPKAAHSAENFDIKNSDPIDVAIEWGKDGPVTGNLSEAVPIPTQVQFRSLPPVCHTDMLKRVHLPYPGRDQSYLWYLQLKSNGTQYGIYLINTESFKKDKSLCPTEVYGIKIDATHYNDMKCTLYHFLAQRSIITMEYTDLRNIINRNAMTTDGYRVLYDIMARIHPALNTDNTFTAPRVGDYSNIHEYYTYFDSYLLHEQYSGRKYTPREQLNRFLCGLDASYAPAITRIRHQLDNWNAKDNSVPENLQLTNLPVLVDQYMDDQGDDAGAIIRRLSKGSHRNKPDRNNNDDKNHTADATARPYVDVKCPLCQSFGHHKYNVIAWHFGCT
jgi:hypothetical protein